MQRELGFNALFVTHNLREAQELADRIGVLMEGRLVQVVEPTELWIKGDQDQGAFIEQPNILCVSNPRATGNGLIEVEWAGFRFFVPDEGKHFERVLIQPRDIFISTLPPPGPPINRFNGRVKKILEVGGMARLAIGVVDQNIDAEISIEYLKTLNLSIGDQVCGILKLRALHGF